VNIVSTWPLMRCRDKFAVCVEFDNVAFNEQNPAVPEPATLALLGLVGHGRLFKVRRKK